MALQLLSHAEQVAAHVREQILGGRWEQNMPGVAHLKEVLGVNHVTVNAAMKLLEQQGLLESRGAKRSRRIVLPQDRRRHAAMRIRILPYDDDSRHTQHTIGLLDQLRQASFNASCSRRTLLDLDMNPTRVARFVGQTPSDAWIVMAASREVLSWFTEQAFPSLALFGRFSGVDIAAASPQASTVMGQAIGRLVSLGHRRIVMLARAERRQPTPALVEQRFLDELEAQGLATGPYNLPDWEDNSAGLIQCLERLFQHTPPTALICGEPRLFAATQQHLARKGIHAPEQVSLICSDPDPTLSWCQPAIAHFSWDHRPVIRRVIRWANHIAAGKTDRQQTLFNRELVEGGTIGPAPA